MLFPGEGWGRGSSREEWAKRVTKVAGECKRRHAERGHLEPLQHINKGVGTIQWHMHNSGSSNEVMLRMV